MALKINIVRPDDLLNLQVECRNLQLDTNSPEGAFLVAEDAAQDAYLIVHFPPQTIAEEAAFEPRPPFPNENERTKELTEAEKQRGKDPFPAQKMQDILSGDTARARLSQPTRLVFRLPANSNPHIPYTIEGLSKWTELQLSVSALADIAAEPTPEQWQSALTITPPSAIETAIELPYRLILSPDHGVVWTDASKVITHAGRTELWHTRLAQRTVEGGIREFSKAQPAPLRAIWSPDYVAAPSQPAKAWPVLGKADEWAGKPVLTAMNKRDRHELVILTSAFRTFVKSKFDLATYVPKPIYAEQMILSALGGWLKSRGSWEPPAEWLHNRLFAVDANQEDPVDNPAMNAVDAVPIEHERALRLEDMLKLLDPAVPEPPSLYERLGQVGESLNISEWVHVATQGRDHYVRIVYEGFLYPFGHRAALIKVTERKFNEVNGTPFAYLAQRMFIVVRQPLKNYAQEGLANDGRAMPAKQVRMTTLVTPDIDFPQPLDKTQYSFWVRVGGSNFIFHAAGQDGVGHAIDIQAALIFVPNSDADSSPIQAIREAYNLSGDTRLCLVPGQPLTYAPPNGNPSDNTTLTTSALIFDTDPPLHPINGPFEPKLAQAKVNIAAVDQLVGKTTPVIIHYFPSYVSGNFDGGNEVFAELVTNAQSEFSADKAGGIATPNLSISGITRKLGAVAGDLKNAASNTFDPKDFFKDVADTATLFGKVKLTDLIVTGDYSKAPTVQFFPQTVPPSVSLAWDPEIKDVDVGFFLFHKQADSTLKIKGLIEQPANGKDGHSRFSGDLTNFSLEFLKVIRLSFVSFHFSSETGKKTDVNVQLQPGDGALEFLGDLKFVNELKKIIPPELFGEGPSLEITPEPAIRAGFAIGLPPVAIGIFALKDVTLGAALTLPFLNGSPLFDFNVSQREHPFNLTVAFFGGGGFFHLQLDTLAVRIVEAAFEFGACASINLGVASGGVHIMAGIYFKLETQPDGSKAATLTGYFRMGGELSVLGLISISLEFCLSFTYESGKKDAAGNELPGKATGIATLTVKVEVLFFSKSIEITVEKKFGGQDGDPRFAEVWDAPGVWTEYAGAFA
jgi:hypothetical protein